MTTTPRSRFLLPLCSWLTCVLTAGTVAAQATETVEGDGPRARILEVARQYRDMTWSAEERHSLHGEDANGVQVDTPDTALDPEGWKSGEENVGMPYCWGGFTALDEFERELAKGRYAGHVPSAGNALPSGNAVGVDCSGFVSRAWDLPLKQSTRSLGALCYELDGYEQLLPGDIVNRFDSHVALFVGWGNDERTEMRVIESARLRVEESTYALAALERSGFRPMRYKPLDERWVDMARLESHLGAKGARFVSDDEADVPELEALPNPLTTSRAGDWARYEGESARLRGTAVCTWLVAHAEGETRELQRVLVVDEGSLATGSQWEGSGPLLSALLEFAVFSDPLVGLSLVTSSIEAGEYRSADGSLPAYRVSLFLEGNSLSRSTHYPAELVIEAVVSPEIPAFGLCEVSYELNVTWGSGEDAFVVSIPKEFTLQAYGREGSPR
jgi:hypothetical protein